MKRSLAGWLLLRGFGQRKHSFHSFTLRTFARTSTEQEVGEGTTRHHSSPRGRSHPFPWVTGFKSARSERRRLDLGEEVKHGRRWETSGGGSSFPSFSRFSCVRGSFPASVAPGCSRASFCHPDSIISVDERLFLGLLSPDSFVRSRNSSLAPVLPSSTSLLYNSSMTFPLLIQHVFAERATSHPGPRVARRRLPFLLMATEKLS